MAEPHPHFDWETFLEGCNSCVVYCHGGCPDGLGAARLTCLALKAMGLSRSEIVELEHTDRARKAAELVAADAAVLYVDISPYEEDLPLLRLARRVLVLDHHASVRQRMAELAVQMPSLVDLSETEGDECAASLVGREMHHLLRDIPELDKKIALLRKKDVWHYQIPSEWAADASMFVASMQVVPRATMAMIDEYLADLQGFLAKGVEAMRTLQQNAAGLFERVRVVMEADYPSRLVVLGVEFVEPLAYDSRHFSKLCCRYANAFVLRALLYSSPEVVDVRLSRTAEDIGELGSLALRLHEEDPERYVGGGGHPYAAGLQVSRSGYDLARVARDLLNAAGAVPADIAREFTQDALDVGIPKRRRNSFSCMKVRSEAALPRFREDADGTRKKREGLSSSSEACSEDSSCSDGESEGTGGPSGSEGGAAGP
mmetsp:Transcript_51940/g.161147  ORF Transcript_51940/g.161147 Transcript_51940/m.161147 type:complete len:429 (-) Transcript_51940:7-1293(-)